MSAWSLEELVQGYAAEGDLGALRHLRQIPEAWYERPG